MIPGGHRMHKISFYQCLMGMNSNRHIFKNHPLIPKIFSEIVIDNFTIILCSNSRKDRTFCLRNSESFKGLLDRIRNFIPSFPISSSFWLSKIINVFEVQFFQRGSPLRKIQLTKNSERLKPEFKHPTRFIIRKRYLSNHLFRKSSY